MLEHADYQTYVVVSGHKATRPPFAMTNILLQCLCVLPLAKPISYPKQITELRKKQLYMVQFKGNLMPTCGQRVQHLRVILVASSTFCEHAHSEFSYVN